MFLQLLKRLDSPAAVCQCMEALVHGDLDLPQDGGHSRADALLPLYIPYEATSERRLWLADLLVALLQRAQVGRRARKLLTLQSASCNRSGCSQTSANRQQLHVLARCCCLWNEQLTGVPGNCLA